MNPGVQIELNQHLCLCWTSWELWCVLMWMLLGTAIREEGDREREGRRGRGGEVERESVSQRGCSVCPPLHISMNTFQNCWGGACSVTSLT